MSMPLATTAALAQNRHQGGLREYVNQKLAPYIKKALKDVCDVDAEYPLQWLGEHLINQSLLYENNPDTTGIKERFFYNFDEPHSSSARTPTAAGIAAADAAADADAVEHDHATSTGTTAAVGTHFPSAAAGEPATQIYNGEHPVEGQPAGAEEVYDIREQMNVGQEDRNHDTNTDMLNGVAEVAREESGTGHVNGERDDALDTEMAGTT